MTKLMSLVLFALVALVGCAQATDSVGSDSGVEVREWKLAVRECNNPTTYHVDCREWQSETIPVVDKDGPQIKSPLGGWAGYVLDTDSDAIGIVAVTLWFQYSAPDSQEVYLTTRCDSEGAQEGLKLLDRPAGKYYELTLTCSVNPAQ